MSRSLLGAAAGAGGASIYFTGLGDSLRYVLDQGMGFTRGSGGASMADKHYDELYRMVQQLSTEMGRRQQGITIVHGSDSKGGALYYVVAVAAGGVIYLRVFRGWKLVDLMYVTRSSLKKSVGQLSEGLDGLGQRLSSVKTYLQSQIKALSGKQDQTMAAQAAMREHLSAVGADVESTRAEVSEVHGAVRELESSMEQLSLSQQYANRGIYILCKVVGDMMKGPSGGGRAASAAELESYIRHPPTLGGRVVPGLEGLLQDGAGDSRSSTPFGRPGLEASKLAREAAESAQHPAERLPQSQQGGPAALDRSYSERPYTTHSSYGHHSTSGAYGKHPGAGGYGQQGGGGYGGGSHGGWQREQLSPRGSLPHISARHEPDTPTRDRQEEPRQAWRGAGDSMLRQGSQRGRLAPWDRQTSSTSSSFDGGNSLDVRF